MKDLIKILYVPSLNIPVVFWRIEHYARTLLNHYHGKRCYVNVETEGLFNIQKQIAWDRHIYDIPDYSEQAQAKLKAAFKFFDVIIFQKIQNLQGLEYICSLKKEFPKTLTYAEIDDSIGEITPSNSISHKFKDHHNVAAEHCAQMNGVIASTEYLANSVKKYNENTFVAPNCISKELFKFEIKKDKSKTFNLGYVGGGGHAEDLLIAYKAIQPLLKTMPNLKFIIRYGGYKPDFIEADQQIDFKSWNIPMDRYAQSVADLNIDLNLIPLRDTEFNRCKSNLKLLESSAMGIPAVVSDVEPYRQGPWSPGHFFAKNDPDDFRDKIIMAISGKSKIKHRLLSETLQKWCYDNYNIEKECSKLLDFLYSGKKVI